MLRMWLGTSKRKKALYTEIEEQIFGKWILSGPCRDNGTQKRISTNRFCWVLPCLHAQYLHSYQWWQLPSWTGPLSTFFQAVGGRLKVLSESFRPWLFSSKNNPHAKVTFWGSRFCSPILASPVFFCHAFISKISFCPFQITYSIPNLFAKIFLATLFVFNFLLIL